MTLGSAFDVDFGFGDEERRIGADFVRTGDAELTHSQDGLYEAEIRHFKRRVLVWMRVDGKRIVEHGCDCPHFDETGTGCEHLAALLLLLAPSSDEGDEDDDFVAIRPSYRLTVDERRRPHVQLIGEDGRPLAMTAATWTDVHDDLNVAALRRLAPFAGGLDVRHRSAGFTHANGPWLLEGAGVDAFLTAAAATGRLEILTKSGTRRLRSGEPLDLAVRATAGRSERTQLRGCLLREDGEVVDGADCELIALGSPPFVVRRDSIHVVHNDGAATWLRMLSSTQPLEIPGADPIKALVRIEAEFPLPRLVGLEPRDRPLRTLRVVPRLRAVLERAAGERTVDVAFRYGPDGPCVSHSQSGALVLDAQRCAQWERDRAAEACAIERLLDLPLEASPNRPDRFSFAPRREEEILDGLEESGAEIIVSGRLVRSIRSAPWTAVSHDDWFELRGGLTSDDGEPPLLTELLDRFRGGDPLLEAADGRLLLLTPELRDRLRTLRSLRTIGQASDTRLRFLPSQVGLVAAILGQAGDGAESAALLGRFEGTTSASRAALSEPPGFVGKLRPYQCVGLGWCASLATLGIGGILADEMGLGKTPLVVAEMLRRRNGTEAGPHLVVVPRSLIGNWRDELGRFAPGLEVTVHLGVRRDIDRLGPAGVLLTTYGTMLRDIDALASMSFDLVVLDEAQIIKNPTSKTSIAARSLTARTRLAVTGTPVENELSDLFSLLDFAAPGLIRDGAEFRRSFSLDEPQAIERLSRALRPVVLRRRKDEVAADLPELIEQTLRVDLEEDQARVYHELHAAARRACEGGDSRPAQVLQALLRLRQAACHPALLGVGGAKSGKMEVLLDRLEEARASGRKVLVFSQFTSLLDLCEFELKTRDIEFTRLDGSTRDRETPIHRFQSEPEVTAFLVSLKAGGAGLNLTAADVVILMDPWWNPAAEAQAIARAHRIGRQGSVHALRIVARDTVEEKILLLQERKRGLANLILDIEDTGSAAVSMDDLRALILG